MPTGLQASIQVEKRGGMSLTPENERYSRIPSTGPSMAVSNAEIHQYDQRAVNNASQRPLSNMARPNMAGWW